MVRRVCWRPGRSIGAGAGVNGAFGGDIEADRRVAASAEFLAHQARRRFKIEHHARHAIGLRRIAEAAHDARARPFAARAARQRQLRVGDIDHEARWFAQEERARLRRAIERQRHAARGARLLHQHAADRRRRVGEGAARQRRRCRGQSRRRRRRSGE